MHEGSVRNFWKPYTINGVTCLKNILPITSLENDERFHTQPDLKGWGGGGGTPTYKLYHPLVNTKVICLSWLVIFQVQLLIYFLQLLSLYRKGILDALIVESKAKCSWTLLKLLQINLLFKTLQNYILNQFKTTGCTHTSVCVADCYFIVNVPDLPFVSPIVKDH